MTVVERGSFQLLNEIKRDFDVFQSSGLDQILEVQIRSRKVVSCVSVFINVHLAVYLCPYNSVQEAKVEYRRYRASVLLPQAR